MARGDGKNRCVIRNGCYSWPQVGNMERHNERKNTSYQNPDVELSCSHLNIYFKKPEEGYLADFDRMCDEGTISTKGLKATTTIVDEMLCDVTSSYFEEKGGYDFAKEFFTKAYEFAVKEAGGRSIFSLL